MLAKRILQKVRQDYSLIAVEFDATRKHPWPEFAICLREMKKYFRGKRQIKLLDVGCGNGRLYEFLKNEPIVYKGIDNNKNLVVAAKENYPDAKFLTADILKLPYSPNPFDAVWCIAVLHHIPTSKLQLRALKQIKKTLTPRGLFVLTVWNLWQKKYKKYIDPKTHDALIPWGSPPKAKRFYHAFTGTELRKLLMRAGFLKIKKIKSRHNIVFVCTTQPN